MPFGAFDQLTISNLDFFLNYVNIFSKLPVYTKSFYWNNFLEKFV